MRTPAPKILVVDDEVLIALEIAHAVKDLGFEVVGPALRLSDALEIAKTEEFDAACLDVNLGRGQTSEPIARALTDRGIPYVFISAYSSNQIGFARSDDTVVSKPVSNFALRKALMQIAA